MPRKHAAGGEHRIVSTQVTKMVFRFRSVKSNSGCVLYTLRGYIGRKVPGVCVCSELKNSIIAGVY